MKSRILEIVVFLVDYLRQNRENNVGSGEISTALKNMGYSEQEIAGAYNWFIDQFTQSGEPFYIDFPSSNKSVRVLTEYERTRITPEAYGFLLKLQNDGIITDEQLEIILERVGTVGIAPVDQEQVMVIASSIVFEANQPAQNASVSDESFDDLPFLC